MKIIDEKIVFQGEMIEVVQKLVEINGKQKIFENGRRAPGVRLIIETGEGFLITKEERPEIGMDFRIAGGKVFDSLLEYNQFLLEKKNEGEILEKAKETAIREAMEEVGVKPTELELFYISKCGGSLEWDLYYFIVKKYEKTRQNLTDWEKIEVLKVSKEELKEMALTGKMQEDRSAAVILRYLNSKH